MRASAWLSGCQVLPPVTSRTHHLGDGGQFVVVLRFCKVLVLGRPCLVRMGVEGSHHLGDVRRGQREHLSAKALRVDGGTEGAPRLCLR